MSQECEQRSRKYTRLCDILHTYLHLLTSTHVHVDTPVYTARASATPHGGRRHPRRIQARPSQTSLDTGRRACLPARPSSVSARIHFDLHQGRLEIQTVTDPPGSLISRASRFERGRRSASSQQCGGIAGPNDAEASPASCALAAGSTPCSKPAPAAPCTRSGNTARNRRPLSPTSSTSL